MFGQTGSRRVFKLVRSVAAAGAVAAALLFAGSALGVISEISIESLGFLPGVVEGGGSQDLQWTNNTQVPHRVAASDGLFDSGTIPPGGGFSMKLQVPGTHRYTSGNSHAGTIVVPLRAIPGPDTDPVADHVPDLEFPEPIEDDVQISPHWGVPASRTRIVLGFKTGTTVAQANAALAAAGAAVIGGLPDPGILLAQVAAGPLCPSCDPFENLTPAVTSLRGNAGVDFAAMSFGGSQLSIPRGAGDGAAVGTNAWTWDTALSGGNWGLKDARFPEAWNFLESIRRKSPTAITGIMDGGIDGQHPDLLPTLTVATKLCPTPSTCRNLPNKPFDHATKVAGIIGAAYDNDYPPKPGTSLGVSGANPVAQMQSFSTQAFDFGPHVLGGSVWIVDKKLELMDLILRSRPPEMRVINYSGGLVSFIEDDNELIRDGQGRPIWWKNFPNKTCDPGTNDDEAATAPGTKSDCTPDNEDSWLREMDQIGHAAARIAAVASQDGVMIVQAAGNDSWNFCHPTRADCHVPIHAESRNEYAWASANWAKLGYAAQGLPDPVLVVEAYGDNGKMTQFSNRGGDVAAPGEKLLTTTINGGYAEDGGTSAAAPFATALAGYLLADDPSLSLAELRHRVVDYAMPTILGGDAPRLDAFASMLAGPGAAKRLVDVNDASRDGNRRIIREPDGNGGMTETPYPVFSPARGELTAPDGWVDMRDFRRFRDAYLEVCAAGAGDTHCPPAGDISLDGDATHPKKDLNFDRCVETTASSPRRCNALESRFSRFDFNGDGDIDVLHTLRIPLKPDGQPAANYEDGTHMNDLDVLRSQWAASTTVTEGWTRDDLVPLLQSADLEVHADRLFEDGASKVQLQVRQAGIDIPVGPQRTLTRLGGFGIVTVPLGDDLNQEYELVATATAHDRTWQSVSGRLRLRYGQDVRVDLCPGISLAASPGSVAADGSSTSRIQLTLDSCSGARDVSGKPITWSLSPANAGASLDLTPGTTDGNGKAAARFRAGTTETSYTVKAVVDLGGGVSDEATVVVRTVPKLTIKYVWQQVYEDYDESGSTRWTANTNPLLPDCRIPGVVEYCIDASHVELGEPGLYGARRTGELRGAGSTFELTEAASNTFGLTRDSWTISKPDGTTKSAEDLNQWFVTDPNAYSDYAVDGLVADDATDGVHLDNLEAVGDLPYHYALTTTRTAGDANAVRPLELGVVRNSMLLVPQDSGASIRFAAGPGKEIVFGRNADGTLRPFRSCGRLDEDLTTQPGYYVQGPSDYIPGATSIYRKPDYTGGDRPMPVGPGHLRIRYAFSAVTIYAGDTVADPQLPDCTVNHPPAATFSYTPQSPDEGRQIAFTDGSTDVDNDISKWQWTFGDGGTASTPNPYHLFQDNGSYSVSLTVTDKDGASDTAIQQVVVNNLPPEAELDDAYALTGETLVVPYRLADAGGIDKTQLAFTITSTNKLVAPLTDTREAGNYTYTIKNAPVGNYPLTLTVHDKDGGVTSVTAMAVVIDEPVPIEDEPVRTYASCDPTHRLDAEEARFLDEVNAYREKSGLKPVAVSPTLLPAAEGHAHDMAVHDFMSHTGSDGSNPGQRAWRVGYLKTATVGENLARGMKTGHDALFAWRASTHGHNENMIDPRWKAIGIAREQGSGGWFWSTSYGDYIDCPKATLVTAVAATDAEAEAAPKAARSLQLANDTATAPAYPPTPAFTMSKARPLVGHAVTFTNRSRDAQGSPIAAKLDFGEGDDPVALGPNESVDYAFQWAIDGMDIRLKATDSAGASAEVARWVYVDEPPAPWLEYTGPWEAQAGKPVTLTARATTGPDGAGVPGLPLKFSDGGEIDATAVTDANGVASVEVTLTAGTKYFSVKFAGNEDWKARMIFTSIYVFENAAPTSDPGGPYVFGLGNSLVLDGSGSTDPDAYDAIQSYEWDLDHDGAFDDASGRFPLPVNWDDVAALVCGGTCAPDHDYPIALRVTDTHENSASASTVVRFVSDFVLTLGGESHVVVPGASNSFAVSVIASGAFTEPVTLSMQGLPDGVTAEFSVNPVQPGHLSVLKLTASQTAATGEFPIVVSGTAAGITHTVSDEMKVAFGLVPVCYGKVVGTVRDGETGAPVAGAQVTDQTDWMSGWVTTDANGRFAFPHAILGYNNEPVQHSLWVTKDGWWGSNGQGLVVCGATTTIDLTSNRQKTGHVSGKVVEGIADPTNPTHVTPTTTPIANATVSAGDANFQTAADGTWSGDLLPNPDNSPRTYQLTGSAPGYWSDSELVNADPTTPAQASFALVKKCYGTFVGGTVVYTDTHEPAPFHTVKLWLSSWQFVAAQTDAEGKYTFNRLMDLGYNNAPVSYTLDPLSGGGDPPGTFGEQSSIGFGHCGDVVASKELRLRRVPMARAHVEGYVTDDVTNEPVAGVFVSHPGDPQVMTDANGYFKVQASLGFGASSGWVNISMAKNGYDTVQKAGWVNDGQLVRWDATIHLKRFKDRTLTGLVRDAATGAPIPGAYVEEGACQYDERVCVWTDRDGRYTKKLTYDERIGPIGKTLWVSSPDYWTQQKQVTLAPGSTTTLDVDLVRKCETARVSGTVVNANTQAPIEFASVQGGGSYAVTDAAGRFVLAGLQPGATNNPMEVGITASATGYFSQTKVVTIFCGAKIVVDFGTRETSLGVIVGNVKNADTGNPLANTFIGTEFGGTATTDANGDYRIEGVPLGDLNSDKAWQVSAMPAGFKPQTKTVVAKAGVEVRADFAFSTANVPPAATPQSVSTDEDVNLPITLAGSDADGDPLSFTVMKYPKHGTLQGSAPALAYKPDQDWNGADSFEFVANDGAANSERAAVTIDVKPVNDPPWAIDDQLETTVGVPLHIPAATLTANDEERDGDALTITKVTRWGDQPVRLEGQTVVFEPEPGYKKPIYSVYFSYTVSDGHGEESTALVYIKIDDAPAAPVCPARSFQASAGKQLAGTLLCTDANADSLTYSVVDPPAQGTLEVQTTGSFTYTPPAGVTTGTVTFTYRAGDGTLQSEPATVTISITAANAAPECQPVSLQTYEDVTLAGSVSCTDPDGDPLTYSLVSGPAHGTIVLQSGGAFTYVPADDYHGTDSFRFRAADAAATSAAVEASVTVAAVNDPPSAVDDDGTTNADVPLVVVVATLLANDEDPDGDALTVTSVVAPTHGSVSFDGTKATFTPASGYAGSAGFRYRIADGNGGEDEAGVIVTIGAVNRPPAAADDAATVAEDDSIVVEALANDSPGAGEASQHLSATLLGQPAHGLALVTAGGISYKPNGDYNGADTFAYLACDDGTPSKCASATVTVGVTPVNDRPEVVDGTLAIAEDAAPTSVDLGALASDVETSAAHLTYELVGAPAKGTVTGNGPIVAYEPNDDANGDDTFAYRVVDRGDPDGCVPEAGCDAPRASETRTIHVTIAPVNDAPAVTLDPAGALAEGGNVALVAHGSDPDGDALTFAWHADGGTLTAAGGTATLSVVEGPASIPVTVTVTDGTANADAQTTVSVVNVAPQIEPVAGRTGVEGDSIAIDAAFDDPGADTHAATIDWGDGTTTQASVSGRAVTGAHVYVDNGNYTATIAVGDDDGGVGNASVAVSVANAAPVPDAGADATAPWGILVAFAGKASDRGSADTAAGLHPVWTFGDGSASANGLATAHAYAAPGTYTATLTATDKDAGTAADDVAVQIVRRSTSLAADATPTTLSARLTDADDAATARLGGQEIAFEVAGSSYKASVDSAGRAQVTLPSPLPAGTYQVAIRFAGDELYAAAQTTATLTVSGGTPGHVTGGGLRTSANGRGGFNVHSDGRTVKGELEYQSPTAGNFHASTMTSLEVAPDGKSASFEGVGVDGRQFRAYVEDNGEPGRRDVWRLWIAGRLETDGTLSGGDIQIHK